ncbi:MAG TPA: protein kinase [Polyangiaceae bacterium]|nr:protein kinase [Polyangiaceae bacterium]
MTEADSSDSRLMADRYAMLDRLGAGGVGVVYRARDQVTGRVVAFKQLLSAKAGKRAKTLEALFEREYHTLVRLKHPRIIEVYDYGVTAEGPYYTMELLEGSDLVQLQQLPYADVCRHLRDVASSLALLHAQRLVHRDVSPRNVRVTADGTARLLDFGALASFGVNTEIIGTPAFMAPEILHQWPLDPRTDLYSLGAVGYFCLTGRPAFSARDVSELPGLWQTPPVPPSELVPHVPEELERLLLSMLSQDPLGRPETAAAVIDQLTVIGNLPPEAHERAEQSYFLSSPMVGRAAQIDWAVRRIEQALEGKGGEVLVEGPIGIGKTRLANELGLTATLKGAVTLRADAESTHESFGAATALTRRLFEACPEIARRAAEPHAGVLRKLAPELADSLGGATSGVQPSDAGDDRVRAHAALREWFLAASRERAMFIWVDNVHAADDDSASFLLALGQRSRASRLLVLTTLRTGASVTAPETVRMLREQAQRLKLPSLDANACEQLSNGLFGGAANAGRVGSLLWQRSGGVPRQFIELAQLMVKRKIAKYEAGSWVLPLDVAEDELPARSEEILAARLSDLGPDAIALAESLAVHSGAVSLARILSLSELAGEGRTHAALDELLAEQVLVSEGDGYRFRHDAIREAVLSRTDPDVLRKNRLRAAEALLESEASGVVERVEAALHLVNAGEEQLGARILVGAARDFAAGAGTHRNADRLVRALCRLVRAYDEQGRSDYELGALLFPLMPLAYYSGNWQFMLEYGERAIEIGIRITGLARAAELAPELGRREALKRGLAFGAKGFAEHAADAIGYDSRTALAATIGMVPACVAVYATCFDADAVARVVRAITPITFFGEEHVAHAMYLFAVAEANVLGNESESRAVWERALSRFEDPAVVEGAGEARTRALRGGVLFMLRLLDCYHFGDRALEEARHMESLGVKAWAVTADQVRMLYHALRGESAEVKTYMERVEQDVVQGAQTWQAEVFWPALLLNADVLTGDSIGARRRYVQLERRAQEVAVLKPQAEAARAAYLMLRGDLAGAISLYERLMPSFPCRRRVGWETNRAYFARALNAAGEYERAKAIAEEVVANMVPADDGYVVRFLEARRQLALAESGLGNHDRAAALLDELLAEHGGQSNALLVGLLHEARAQVAEGAKDVVTAMVQRAEMESCFRRTKNPLLVARCERASRSSAALSAAREHHHSFGATVSAFRTSPFASSDAATIAEPRFSSGQGPLRVDEILSHSDEPFEVAVDFVMRKTKAKSAYLYVSKGGELRLAWSSTNDEPPASSVEELARWLDVAVDGASQRTTPGSRERMFAPAATAAGCRLVALQSPADGKIVGGLILEIESGLALVGATDVFEALGRVIGERGLDAFGFITV